jgi:hypothetical protein
MLSLHGIAVPIAVSSAALAYLAYRVYAHRVRRAQHELYTEVCNEREALCHVVETLPEQLESAKRWRIAGLRTRGPSGLEATRQWLEELERDLAEVILLRSQLPAAEVDGADQSEMELDIRLAEILALAIRANRLADKYRELAELRSSQDFAAEQSLDEEALDEESLLDQAASLSAQARAQQAMSFIAPS